MGVMRPMASTPQRGLQELIDASARASNPQKIETGKLVASERKTGTYVIDVGWS